MMDTRIIGRHKGKKNGPLLICIGGIHGNEPAGIQAIEEVLRLLQIEPEINPGFEYHGVFLGIKGNLQALSEEKRYIGRDLNRMLAVKELQRIEKTMLADLTVEDTECRDLIQTIEGVIKKYDPQFTLILDFHTTTADGGIFTIASDDKESRELAIGLHAPVILGIAEGLSGTTIEYFNRPHEQCHCIVFEAGQHDDPECIDRSIAAIVNCMRSIDAVKPHDVHHRHDDLLIRFSEGLPKLTRLVYHYKLSPNENFIMKPGFINFQPILKGEALAWSNAKSIYAPCDGYILMPKYQQLGEDGFFIVKQES